MVLGNSCIFRVVTDGRALQNAFRIKLGEEQNNRVHTFNILEVLWGKMQTWYPCFILKKKSIFSYSPWT